MTILAALALFAVAAAASLISAWPGAAPRFTRVVCALSWVLLVAAAIETVVLGATGVAGGSEDLGLGELGGLGVAHLRVDRLSGLFIVISFAVAVPALIAGVTTKADTRPRLPAAVAAMLASVLVILTADHLFVLLFGWESLTVAFYLLAGFDRSLPGRPRASVAAVVFGKVSGAALLAGGLILSATAGGFTFDQLAGATNGLARDVGYALLLLGFGVKVGWVPVQVWLPPTYAAAPPLARALMAGCAVNVGFYGMWRTLQVLGPAPVWLATTILVIAGVTAVLGIAHAAVHPDLTGLIAWSSVENAGVITAGFGAALVGAWAHNNELVAAGLLAGTAQVIAHALGKSLLFTATAAVEPAAGTTDLDALRGIARRMPFAGVGIVVGSLTLAGMPLTAGFASEWLTLESLMQQFRVDSLPLQLASAFAGALVALTVGIAGVTFVRLIALTAFGRSPSVPLDKSAEADGRSGHRLAISLLSAGCLAVSIMAPLEVRMIAAGLEPIVGRATRGGLASAWVIQPIFPKFSALSPTWLWIVLPTFTLAIAGVTAWISGSRLWRVRRVEAWSSASPGVDRGIGYTSFAYANPMRTVMANLLLTTGQLRRAQRADPDRADTAAELRVDNGDPLRYDVDVVEVVTRYFYGPLWTGLMRVVRVAKRLQSGRLDAYMTYMLIAVVAVLAIVSATR